MKAYKNRVRIIGGYLGGKYINVLDHKLLRPTPNRVRETLFNWLGQDLSGQTCADLFSGSGALGFEAVSRNAKHVVFVEDDYALARTLVKQAHNLGIKNIDIRKMNAIKFCQETNSVFDVVFLDPPFSSTRYDDIWFSLINIIRPGSLIYIESDSKRTVPPSFAELKQSKAGQVFYVLLEYRPR